MLVVSGSSAEKPSEKVKPPGRTKPECIVFTDNPADFEDPDHVWLEGGQDCAIVGCCPNAGPAPAYTMTLHNLCFPSPDGTDEGDCYTEVTIDGYLFLNTQIIRNPGGPRIKKKIVKFWTWDGYNGVAPGANGLHGFNDFFFEIRGGTWTEDKKVAVKPVEFWNENATLWVYYDEADPGCDPNEPDCPCIGIEPGCYPSSDPNCFHPCFTVHTIGNVSFVRVRTDDLDYISDDYGFECPDAPCPSP
jgi:hypothetical protein